MRYGFSRLSNRERSFVMRKKVLLFFTSGVFLVFTLLGSFSLAEAKTITLRYAAQGASKGIRAEAVKWWAKEIEKKSNGAVKFKFFWSGALLKAGDALEGIGSGTANIGGGWGIYHPAKTPLWTVADPPFSHSDPYVGLKTMQELFRTYEPMKKELDRYNVVLLTPFVSGMTQLGTTKKPVLSPQDAKGMKIRFAGGQWAKFWDTCGAVPLKLTQGEVYEAMMRGTADGTQSYFFILEAYKHWDVLKHYSVINAGEICSYGLVMNKDNWNELTPEIKSTFRDVSDQFVEKYAQALIESRKRIKKLAGEKGVRFYELNEAQKAAWDKKAEPFMKAWVKSMEEKGQPGEEAQKLFTQIRDKYQAETDSNGYPWE
jgi:TRAP-type C4-dicarboxylate transport system substrate-binding protein